MATAAAIRLGPADHGRPMSLDEFMDADAEEGCRYELARGVLEVTEVPNDPHGQVVSNLYVMIARYMSERPGRVLRYGGGAEFRIWLPGMGSGRNPDLGVVLRGSPRDHRGRRIPALVAEVVSEESVVRDYVTKREEYLRYGLREYWIVDPLKRQVTVLTRDGDAWREQVARDTQAIPSLVLPGLPAAVADLWQDLDEQEAEDAGQG